MSDKTKGFLLTTGTLISFIIGFTSKSGTVGLFFVIMAFILGFFGIKQARKNAAVRKLEREQYLSSHIVKPNPEDQKEVPKANSTIPK